MDRADRNGKPVIGLSVLHGNAEWVNRNSAHYLAALHMHAAAAGRTVSDSPVQFPGGVRAVPAEDGVLPTDVLDMLDGIVLSGGGDIHPSHFGQTINGAEPDRIDPKRDALELGLASAALERDLPILGICRGCQVLNVAAGGALVQHFDGHRSPLDATSYHQVDVLADSGLMAVAATPCMRVNTFHHQGIDRPGLAPGFIASGVAEPDAWLFEAIESPTHRWVLGVQWHPERLFELDDAHRRIWRSFVSACNGKVRRRR